MHELEEAVESFENATYLENLDGVPQVRVIDLNQRAGVRLTSRSVELPLHQPSDSVDSPGPLLHGRGRPGDAVVDDAAAEGVQVLAFLEHIRRYEHQREPWHAKLADQALVDAAGHPADGDLLLKGGVIDVGELRQRRLRHFGEVDRDDVTESV